QSNTTFRAKYDQNQNGVVDPDEKEAALDNSAFVELERDTIDVNGNCRLDASELVYFDANNNKILDPKEQAGIGIAQHLLAEKFSKIHHFNGDTNAWEALQKQRLWAELRSSQTQSLASIDSTKARMDSPARTSQMFKQSVEAYWKNSNSTNH